MGDRKIVISPPLPTLWPIPASSEAPNPTVWAYFGAKENNRPFTHRGTLRFCMGTVIHQSGRNITVKTIPL